MLFNKKRKKRKGRKRKKITPQAPLRRKSYPNIVLILDEHMPTMGINDFAHPQPKKIINVNNGISDREVLEMVMEKAKDSPRHFVIITSDRGFKIDSGWTAMVFSLKKPSNISVLDFSSRKSSVRSAFYGKSKQNINRSAGNTKKCAIRNIFAQFMKETFSV